MRLANYEHEGRDRTGIVVEAGVIDLEGRLGRPIGVLEALEPEVRAELTEVIGDGSPDLALEDVRWRLPLPDPGRIFCIGVNYGGRNAEYKDGAEAPVRPSVFMRGASSLVPHEAALIRPPESHQLDYEGEIVAIVARRGRRIAREAALSHLGGLTLGNEGTLRDWVRHSKFNVTQGKNFDRSGSLGPFVTTMDEVGDVGSLRLTTRVNGELRQDDTTASMAFPIADLIAYLSTFTTLEPGDLIFTGTPTGAGARFDPPRFLAPGDVVEVSVAVLGTLRNGVRDE